MLPAVLGQLPSLGQLLPVAWPLSLFWVLPLVWPVPLGVVPVCGQLSLSGLMVPEELLPGSAGRLSPG
jgi:hypothetical protein